MDERGSFARRLRCDGPTVFGTWVKLPTIETVELLGHAGLDFIVVDTVEKRGGRGQRKPNVRLERTFSVTRATSFGVLFGHWPVPGG